MAIITEVQLQDGSIHQLGGGGNTYTLSKNGDTITLSGSGGDTSSVTDSDTTYTVSVSGHTLTLTPSTGTAQTITLPDDDTTYTISKSGNTITLTGSDGSTSSVTVDDDDTTYTISVSGHTLTLTGSDGSTSTATLPDEDTTYTLSISGNTLTLTPSSGTAQTITLPIPTKTSDLTNDSDFVSDPNYVHTDNNFTTAEKNKLSGIEAGAEVNVQANWNETDTTSDAYIQNKPTISPQNIWYGTCGTGAATQAKVVTTSDGDFTLTTGNMVRVKFTNAQTYNGTVTLNVDGTGAVDVARVGATKTTRYYWVAGEVVDFVYDGTNFVMSAKGTATTTYYGLTKLSSAINSTSTALAATPSAVKQAYDLADSKVSDVEVNGTSVVNNGVAEVSVPTPSSTTPNMDGTASVGSEANYARGDHRHPSDTSKQDTLVSGTNIKTINGTSLLGSGDISIDSDEVFVAEYDVTTLAEIEDAVTDGKVVVCHYVDQNSQEEFHFLLANWSYGNFYQFTGVIQETSIYIFVDDTDTWSYGDSQLQQRLTSGVNIKTVNNQSLVGSGNITIQGGSGTPIPTADTVAEFDSTAHMNSTDMTTGSGGEVEDFVNSLNVSGGGLSRYVQAGVVNLPSISANGYADANIIFSETMASVPSVTAIRSSAGTVGYILQIAITTRTATGCTIRVWNFGSSAVSPSINWTAIAT